MTTYITLVDGDVMYAGQSETKARINGEPFSTTRTEYQVWEDGDCIEVTRSL